MNSVTCTAREESTSESLTKVGQGRKEPEAETALYSALQETKRQAERLRKSTGFVTVRFAIATKDSPRLYVR